MPWLWLIVGGLFEVGFTTSLRFVDGFRNLPWTLAFLASVAVSMGLLEVASRSIPMGTAYAVWGGIGAVGTVVVGILWFHEPVEHRPRAADPRHRRCHRRAATDRLTRRAADQRGASNASSVPWPLADLLAGAGSAGRRANRASTVR